jgi:hypothetical protein
MMSFPDDVKVAIPPRSTYNLLLFSFFSLLPEPEDIFP